MKPYVICWSWGPVDELDRLEVLYAYAHSIMYMFPCIFTDVADHRMPNPDGVYDRSDVAGNDRIALGALPATMVQLCVSLMVS